MDATKFKVIVYYVKKFIYFYR